MPKAQGGSDSFDNAIVLCFDCHADAGHYNDKHPRGSKFTPRELQLARETWYAIVKEHRLPIPDEPEALQFRYVVGKSFDFLSEIATSDMKHFPLEQSLLVRTNPLVFLNEIIRRYSNPNRPEEVWGQTFPDEQSYVAATHKARQIAARTTDGFAYFRYERIPSREELYILLAQADGVTRLLLNNEVPSAQIARAVAYEDACQGGFPENYRLRPLWGVFLAITNASNQALRLDAIEATLSGSGFKDLQILSEISDGTTEAIKLPAAPIAAQTTVVVPIATLLGPLQHIPYETGYEESRAIDHLAHQQTFSHITNAQNRSDSSYVWGPTILPKHVRFSVGGVPFSQSVHSLDLDNVYEVDRYWQMGSCPHAFSISQSGRVAYLGEVIPQGDRCWSKSEIALPSDTASVIICELEDERTFLTRVDCGEVPVCRNRVLDPGDYIAFSPRSSTVAIEGMYLPHGNMAPRGRLNAVRRNALVSNFIPAIKSLPINAP